MKKKVLKRRAKSWIAGCNPHKKKGPGGYFEAATEADQPGMGMTNRVIPAQGEERGASFTLIKLDGDAARKFQPSPQQFF
jgi:hypothetical protein